MSMLLRNVHIGATLVKAMYTIIFSLVLVTVTFWFMIAEVRRVRKEMRRRKVLYEKQDALFAIQAMQHCLLMEGLTPDADRYQKLLKEEILLRVEIGKIEPGHGFQKLVPSLLSQCTDDSFREKVPNGIL